MEYGEKQLQAQESFEMFIGLRVMRKTLLSLNVGRTWFKKFDLKNLLSMENATLGARIKLKYFLR